MTNLRRIALRRSLSLSVMTLAASVLSAKVRATSFFGGTSATLYDSTESLHFVLVSTVTSFTILIFGQVVETDACLARRQEVHALHAQ